MSLVDCAPSTVIRLKVVAVPAASASRSTSGSATASVVSTASMVAWAPGDQQVRGQHGRPLGHAPDSGPPATRVPACLATVSVVRMASAAAGPPDRSRAPALATPSVTRATSSGTPMTPVEQTSTCSARQPSSAAARSTVASTAAGRPARCRRWRCPS